jgi:hypothetical protein
LAVTTCFCKDSLFIDSESGITQKHTFEPDVNLISSL